jgi:cytochrome c5
LYLLHQKEIKMSDNNKDYFTEMVKLMLGMGIVAIVLIFGLRMVIGTFSSDAVNTGEASQQVINDRLQAVETISLVGGAKPVVKAKAAPKAVAKTPVSKTPAAPKVAAAAKSVSASGEGVKLFQAKCFACHSLATAAALGAPAIGDKKAWAPRIAKGMNALMNTALNGSKINPAMLPKGGAFDLSDTQIKSIVEHMVNSSK